MDELNQLENCLIRNLKSRKVRTLLLLITIFNFNTSFSQNNICDKIIFTNGDEIEAIIKEITPENITYRKCDNIDGPTYVIEKYKIFVVQYKNGSREVITDLNNQKPDNQKQNVFKKPKEHGKFYFGIELGSVNDKSLFKSDIAFNNSFNQLNANAIINYKLNKKLEFDFSLGSGFISYETPINKIENNYNVFDYKNEYIIFNNYLSGVIYSLNLGPRINFISLITNKEIKNINPFFKPELSYFHLITNNTFNNIKSNLSYNLLLGVNIKKHLNFSLGIKFLKIPGYIVNYEGYYNEFINYQSIKNTKFNYNNIIWKLSYEF